MIAFSSTILTICKGNSANLHTWRGVFWEVGEELKRGRKYFGELLTSFSLIFLGSLFLV